MEKNSFSESYKAAGVDITAGYKSVELFSPDVKRTMTAGVLKGIGSFGGLYQLDLTGIKEPVLVSGTDGVGTKLKIAFLLDKHDTIGIDAVAMCVNDIICCGAKPLQFLDYIACGKNHPEKIAAIVKGVADGCVESGTALVGGETAEMPGFYGEDEYDIAGFAVGIVDKSKIIDGSKVSAGDVVIGIASSGIHSNAYSLVRKIFELTDSKPLYEKLPYDENKTLGEELITPTKLYVKPILELIERIEIKAIANITGGGFYENIPRAFGTGLTAKINKSVYEVPPIFKYMQEKGGISERDMYNTFNMGIGMICIVDKDNADETVRILEELGEKAYCIGEIIEGDDGVIII